MRRGRAFSVAAVVLLLLAGCARPPVAGVPSPSARTSAPTDASPVAEVSPVTEASPAGAASPSSSTTTPPRTTPRASPTAGSTPTLAPLVITPPTFPAGEVRIVYADVPLAATGGKAPYSWSINSGALPGGLALSGNTVGGTPSAAGTFTFGLQVTDAAGGTATASGTIGIANYLSASAICAKLCSVEDLCNAVCGTYAKPSGGVGPFKFSLASGALPGGTALGWPDLTGQFTGVGSYSFVVSVSDSLGAGISVPANYSVFPHIAMKVGSLPTGQVKFPYTARIPYSGGSGAPTVAVVKGALPQGLTATVDSANQLVLISGTPTTNGTFSFVLLLTDTSPCSTSGNCFDQTPTLTIAIG